MEFNSGATNVLLLNMFLNVAVENLLNLPDVI